MCKLSELNSSIGNNLKVVDLSLGDNIRTEVDREQDELDHYIKLQKEQLSKGIRDKKQKHMASLLTSIEKGVSKEPMKKDVQIENMNQKSRDKIRFNGWQLKGGNDPTMAWRGLAISHHTLWF